MKLEGYSGYEIYPETGKVWSYYNNKFIGVKDSKGYLRANLQKDNGGQQHWRFHRLIWTVVNGEIPEGMQVNHIDENKENNSIFNLNLMTNYENAHWGTRTDKIKAANTNGKCSKSVLAIKNNKIELFFPSASEGARQGFSQGHISSCARGERPYHKGYQWKYLDDQLADWLEEIQDEDMKKEKVA